MGYLDEKNLEKKIEENLKLNQEIYKIMKKQSKWIIWQEIWLVLQVVIVLLVAVSAWVYVPSIFNKISNVYKNIMGSSIIEEIRGKFPVEIKN